MEAGRRVGRQEEREGGGGREGGKLVGRWTGIEQWRNVKGGRKEGRRKG